MQWESNNKTKMTGLLENPAKNSFNPKMYILFTHPHVQEKFWEICWLLFSFTKNESGEFNLKK